MGKNIKKYKLKDFLNKNLFRKIIITLSILLLILIFLFYFSFKTIEKNENQLTQTIIKSTLKDFGYLTLNIQNTYKNELSNFLKKVYENSDLFLQDKNRFLDFFYNEKIALYNLKKEFEENIYLDKINYYFIDKNGFIYKTDYKPDLNFNLAKFGVWRNILSRIKKGQPYISRLSREYKTGNPRIFGYIKLKDNTFFEIGLKFSGIKKFFNNKIKEYCFKNLKIENILIITYLERPINDSKIPHLNKKEIEFLKKSQQDKNIYYRYISLNKKYYYYTFLSDIGYFYLKIKVISPNLLYLFIYTLISVFVILTLLIYIFIKIKTTSEKITLPILNLYNKLDKFEENKPFSGKQSYTNIDEIDIIFLKYDKLLKKINNNYQVLKEKHEEIKKLTEDLKSKKETLSILLEKEKSFNKKIEKIISVTKKLYSKTLIDDIEFFKLIFRTTFSIIDEADFGSVFIVRNDKIKYIDTIGHDLKMLNELNIKNYEFKKMYNNIKIINNIISPSVNKMSKKKLELLKKASKPIKQTIRLPLYTSYGIVSFNYDISEESKNSFNESSIKILELFKDILTIFFSLKEASNKLDLILNSIGEGIIITDNKDTITTINKSVLEILDANKKNILNKNINRIVFLKNVNDYQNYNKINNNLIIKSEKIDITKINTGFYNFELISNKNNKKFIVLLKNHIYNNFKDLIGTIYILRDNSKEKELQDKYFQFQKFQTLGKFVGGILHDFNNLIGGISGSIELLKFDLSTIEFDKGKKQEVNEYINMILDNLSKGKELVNNLKSLTVKESIVKELVNINDILKNVIFLSKKSMGNDIKLTFKRNNIEYPIILGNKTILSNIFLNLISNAKDALENKEKGKIEIKVEVIENLAEENIKDLYKKDLDKPFYKISIKDNGSGISKDKIDKIFEPFFTTKSTTKGTGLGLAIVKENVKTFNGYIKVKSIINKGTTFSIYFPVINDKKILDNYFKSIKQQLNINDLEKFIKNYNFKNKKVLIVEDEELVRINIKNILQKVGFKVFEAQNGEEAIKKIKRLSKNKLDFIILDLVMPDMNGQEVMENIKNIPLNAKVIVSTGFGKDIDINSMLKQYNISSILFKPYKMVDLLNTLKKFNE